MSNQSKNLFEELGAVGDFNERPARQPSPFNVVTEQIIEETVPKVVFGGKCLDDSAAPPDLTLRAHRMQLGYHDDRVNDPAVRQWMEERRLGVGASEIAVLFGLSPWSTVRELWREKVHGCDYTPGSELFHFGHEMEPLVAAEFARRTGETVDHPPQMIMIGDKPHYRASLDRVVIENGKPVAALELKNLNDARFGEYRAGGPSVGYLLQLQYQMLIADLDYGYLACLFGGQKFGAWQVAASPSVQREILRRVDEFWDYVERKEEPPEILGVRNVKGDSNQGVLELEDPAWEDKLSRVEELRLAKTKIDKEEKMLKQQLKENIGNFPTARAGKMTASVSISTRSGIDMASLRADHPDLIERYTKSSEVKTMRIRSSK